MVSVYEMLGAKIQSLLEKSNKKQERYSIYLTRMSEMNKNVVDNPNLEVYIEINSYASVFEKRRKLKSKNGKGVFL